MSSVACRVRSNGPHWIETHGGAAVQQIAGGPLGLLAIGTNGLVYSYPEFGSLWHEWNGHLRPRIIAGSRAGLHYVDEDGRVGQAGRWRGGSATRVQAPNVTALATDGDAHSIYAISDGHVMQLLGTGAAPGPCPQIRAVSIAVARGALWVSDVGGVYVGTDATCDPIADSPPNVTRLAGLDDRIFAVNGAGDIYRLSAVKQWQRLPRPLKFRPDRMPATHPARDIAVTGTAAWVKDDEGTVFVLSESG